MGDVVDLAAYRAAKSEAVFDEKHKGLHVLGEVAKTCDLCAAMREAEISSPDVGCECAKCDAGVKHEHSSSLDTMYVCVRWPEHKHVACSAGCEEAVKPSSFSQWGTIVGPMSLYRAHRWVENVEGGIWIVMPLMDLTWKPSE